MQYRRSSVVVISALGLFVSINGFGRSLPKLFIPPELATGAKGKALGVLQVGVSRTDNRQDYSGLSVAIDGVTVATPESWQNAFQTMATVSQKYKVIVIANVYVLPGSHRVTYEWRDTLSVPEVRTFGGSETIGGVVDRQVQGFIVSAYHQVTHSAKQEQTVTVGAKQTNVLVPNPSLSDARLCGIDGKAVECAAADQFIRDHPSPGNR